MRCLNMWRGENYLKKERNQVNYGFQHFLERKEKLYYG